MPSSVRELFKRLVVAMNSKDYETLRELVHPEYVGDFPQSGERTRGFEAFKAQIERYPGGTPASEPAAADTQVYGDAERWAITPGYTVVPLAGPEVYTAVSRATYPDGSRWHIVSIVELRDDRIYRNETYFAPEFEPPEWRRDMVEIVPRD